MNIKNDGSFFSRLTSLMFSALLYYFMHLEGDPDSNDSKVSNMHGGQQYEG